MSKKDPIDAARLPFARLRWVVPLYVSLVLLLGCADLLFFSNTHPALWLPLLILLGVLGWGGVLSLRRHSSAVYHLGVAIIVESLFYWLYAGSFRALVWQLLIVGCFLSLGFEQARAWLRWRWLRGIVDKESWDTRPIEGDDAEGLPSVFDWQTKLGSGVLSYRLHGKDAYRDGLQRLPVAIAPFDLQYAKNIIWRRTLFCFLLMLFPVLAYSSWTTRSYFTVSERPTDLALGDIDNDGDLDLVTSHLAPDFLSVLLNDGTGHFGPYAEIESDLSTRSVGLADVDQDGFLDAVTQGLNSRDEVYTYSLVKQISAFSAGTTSKLTKTLLPQSINAPLASFGNQSWQALADLNQTGYPDAVLMTTHGLQVFCEIGRDPIGGPDCKTRDLPHPSRNDYRLSSIALQDIGEDGLLDLVAVAPELGVVFVYRNAGYAQIVPGGKVLIGSFLPPVELMHIDDLASVGFGDLNNDSALDLVANAQHNQSVQIFLGDGKGSFAFFAKVGDQKQGLRATNPKVVLGDLDGDNDVDIVTTDFYNDQVRVLFNDGEAHFTLR